MKDTMQLTTLRAMRLRHGVTLEELAEAVGVSNQYISRAELCQCAPTWTMEKQLEAALEAIILQRYAAVRALEQEYRAHKGALLDYSKEAQNGV